VLSSAASYVHVLVRIRSISEEVRFVCIDLNGWKFRCHLAMWRCMHSKVWIIGGFPSLPCHVDRTENSYVKDAIFCMYYGVYHFCDSNLQPSSIAFFATVSTDEVLCYLTMLDEQNEVAKMRQAGAALAKGKTVNCLFMLEGEIYWCNFAVNQFTNEI